MNSSVWHSFEGTTVLVAGDFMIDRYIEGDVSRISPEAPVPVVSVNNIREALGGAGNVINNIIALGGHARAVTCLGNDAEGDLIITMLNECGANTEFVCRNDETVTIQKTRVVSSHQQFLRYDQEKIAPVSHKCIFQLAENESKLFSEVDILLISDYGKGFITEESAQFLISAALRHNIKIVVDPKGKNYEKYRGATVCTPNLKELRDASGEKADTEENLLYAAEKISSTFGIDNIVVTRSEKGMSLIPGTKAKKDDFPAIAKEVSDVTGAGDTVISVMALAIANNFPFSECCILANQAASVVVSKYGAATVTPQELIGMNNEVSSIKFRTADEASALANQLRCNDKKIVFTNGCYDIIHAGHISSFKQAKSFGDVLIVGLNSDASVKRLKGASRPIVSQENRAKLLVALEAVDYVIIFEDDTPQKLIETIHPDVLVKGKDWESKQPISGQEFIESYGGSVKFIDLEQGLSTTSIVEKIKKSS